jgi:hypothetical protein
MIHLDRLRCAVRGHPLTATWHPSVGQIVCCPCGKNMLTTRRGARMRNTGPHD